ncbi:MAG TPA: hypothetical protein VEV41_12255 [Terriglobales bacterium]|jgi:hypothetical protein|nr:hypothetical protein [Terriglobales bacterium]
MRRLIYLAMGMLVLVPLELWAQSPDAPLGDLARNLRKNQPPPKQVIDNDNLSEVMEAGESKKWGMTALHFALGQDLAQVLSGSAPDVTCALSFNAQGLGATAKPQNLPDTELAKLDGPAAIVGDALQISVHNGTAWDLREITVGLTIVRRSNAAPVFYAGPVKLIPAVVNNLANPEKSSDMTVLYRAKVMAAPSTTTLFREALTTSIGPDEEWHWAIVQAKGIPPAGPAKPSAADPGN